MISPLTWVAGSDKLVNGSLDKAVGAGTKTANECPPFKDAICEQFVRVGEAIDCIGRIGLLSQGGRIVETPAEMTGFWVTRLPGEKSGHVVKCKHSGGR